MARPVLRSALRPVLAAAVFLAVVFSVQDAFAVRLTLKRIVFEGSRRADVMTLVNDRAEAQTYRLRWQDMRMTGDNRLEPVSDGQVDAMLKPARDMVVFAPRRVTIAPGETQQIRLMLRKPAGLADGEYRSHLVVMPEKEAVRFDDSGQNAGTSVDLKMLAGISFPVIVRQGKLTAAASLGDLRLTRQGQDYDLQLSLKREGDRSLYGDFSLYCGGNTKQPVYQLRGIAVYPEIPSRNIHFTFPAPESDCSSLRVVYRAAQDDAVYRGQVIAEATVTLK